MKSKWLLLVAALFAAPLPAPTHAMGPGQGFADVASAEEDDDEGGGDSNSQTALVGRRSVSNVAKLRPLEPASLHERWPEIMLHAPRFDRVWTLPGDGSDALVAASAILQDCGIIVVKRHSNATASAALAPMLFQASKYLRERGVLKIFVGLGAHDDKLQKSIEEAGFSFHRATKVGEIDVAEFYTNLYCDPPEEWKPGT